MSEHTFFAFTRGLTTPVHVPPGTLGALQAHVADVESVLGLQTTQYRDNLPHWDLWQGVPRGGWPVTLTDAALCQRVEAHNAWVRTVYAHLAIWTAMPPRPAEVLTLAAAQTFWHALTLLEVAPARWTADYYRARMEALYEVLRGRPCEGVTLDTRALTPPQAAAVIRLIDSYLDPDDLRLAVPHGHDYLASSSDGGYDWCAGEGTPRTGCFRPMAPDDVAACRRRVCPLQGED